MAHNEECGDGDYVNAGHTLASAIATITSRWRYGRYTGQRVTITLVIAKARHQHDGDDIVGVITTYYYRHIVYATRHVGWLTVILLRH